MGSLREGGKILPTSQDKKASVWYYLGDVHDGDGEAGDEIVDCILPPLVPRQPGQDRN